MRETLSRVISKANEKRNSRDRPKKNIRQQVVAPAHLQQEVLPEEPVDLSQDAGQRGPPVSWEETTPSKAVWEAVPGVLPGFVEDHPSPVEDHRPGAPFEDARHVVGGQHHDAAAGAQQFQEPVQHVHTRRIQRAVGARPPAAAWGSPAATWRRPGGSACPGTGWRRSRRSSRASPTSSSTARRSSAVASPAVQRDEEPQVLAQRSGCRTGVRPRRGTRSCRATGNCRRGAALRTARRRRRWGKPGRPEASGAWSSRRRWAPGAPPILPAQAPAAPPSRPTGARKPSTPCPSARSRPPSGQERRAKSSPRDPSRSTVGQYNGFVRK